jgi:MFS family permease
MLLSAQFTHGFLIIYAFAILYGIGQGTMPPLQAVIVTDFFSGRNVGRILGIQSTAFGLGGALGAVIGGWYHDLIGNYLGAFATMLAAVILSTICIWATVRRGSPDQSISTVKK